jgi:nitrile hydratase accessory protein
MTSDQTLLADLDDGAPVPRSNGELVFQEPWESRAFGLALALCEEGTISWDRFRSQLITEIARWEQERDCAWSYYQRWLAALEKELVRMHLVDPGDVEQTTRTIIEAEFTHEDHGHPTSRGR